MKRTFASTVLFGILVLTLFAAGPSSAAVDCSQRDGLPCSPQGATSGCTYTDEGSGCFYRLPCWCDRAFGPLQWRCGPNPIQTICPVAFTQPENGGPEVWSQPAVASACTEPAAATAPAPGAPAATR